MFIIIKVFVLVALVRLLLATERPLLCSSAYTVIVAVLSLFFWSMTDAGFLKLLGYTVLTFSLSSIYFWLLNTARNSTVWFILILVLGFLIGLF